MHYEKAALEAHLIQDHAMTVDETNELVEYVLKHNVFGPNRKTRGRGRITIKNATQLKKPDLLLENGQEPTIQTKPQPKIFVKSVQYLKRPEFCFNTESTEPVLDTTNNFQDQPTSMDAFPLHTTEPTPPPFTTIFDTMQNAEVSSSYFEEMTTTEPIITTTISPVKTCQSGKIYLKDISVLQDPRPIVTEGPLQQPTIHLKTVDELNAMAFNSMPTSFQSNFSMDPVQDCPFSNVNNDIINLDESDISDLIDLNNDDNYSQNSFTALLNQEFDSVSMETEAKKVECEASTSLEILKDGIAFEQNMSNLNENDEDILFVCAQEIINANVSESDDKTRDLQTPVSTPRIYVASNLTNDFSQASPPVNMIDTTFTAPKQKQGRPKGARQSGVTQWRKNLPKNITEDDVLGPKCQIDGCALRYKILKNMEYHRKCHTLIQNGDTICPECGSTEFKNWNILHTHLWRTHNIDMELYACDKCSFKTPILARLKSEHMKTHSDVRGYKCGLCDKGFKNTKQLKHHVRMHRLRLNPMSSQRKPIERKCNQCNMSFPNTVALESHIIDIHTAVTEKKDLLTSLPTAIPPSSLHDVKKYKCPECNYESNDHNSYRRHKFQHSKDSLYKCQFCSYSSIQSTTYRKHLEKQHPDKAPSLVFKCQVSSCTFTTINKQKFDYHVINRHQRNLETANNGNENQSENDSQKVVSTNKTSGIKVRQILTLTDPIHVSSSFIRPASFANIELDQSATTMVTTNNTESSNL